MTHSTVACFSWDGIFTVFTYTSPQVGGLGLPVRSRILAVPESTVHSPPLCLRGPALTCGQVTSIGMLYSVGALLSIVSNPVVLPSMRRFFGPKQSLALVLGWTCIGLLIPLGQLAALDARWLMWCVVGAMTLLRVTGSFAWTSVLAAINLKQG